MEQLLNLRNFSSQVSNLAEPEFFKDYRKDCFEKIKLAPEISFRYGLNILIKPRDFNIDKINPRFDCKIYKEISQDNKVKIYSGNLYLEGLEENDMEILGLLLSEEWDEDYINLDYFNQAYTNDILFIKIPRNIELDKPIVIDYNYLESTLSNIFIYAEENTKAQIFLSKSSDNKDLYISDTIRMIAKENSKIEIITLQNLDKRIFNIQNRKAFCNKDSYVQIVDVILGSNYTKSSVVTRLEESGAVVKNIVLYLLSDEQIFDLYTSSVHGASNTSSNILTKGVLNKESKALSRGLVKIEKNAFGSNGYEKQEALLLSDKAVAYAIPNLEIKNHDVKCSHGSSIGQLDENKVFYLMSRGLNKTQAQKKIIEGYFIPIINVLNDNIKNKIYESIEKKL